MEIMKTVLLVAFQLLYKMHKLELRMQNAPNENMSQVLLHCFVLCVTSPHYKFECPISQICGFPNELSIDLFNFKVAVAPLLL